MGQCRLFMPGGCSSLDDTVKDLRGRDARARETAPTEFTPLSKALEKGELSFRGFVEHALYDPAEGFYSGARNPVGPAGDFITAPRISPVFGYALSRLAGEFLHRTGDGLCAIVDIGCGDGKLIHSIVENLSPEELRRASFYGVDRSLDRVPGSLRQSSRITFFTDPGELPQDRPLLLISNELFDAFPWARLVQRQDGLRELWVRSGKGGLEWTERDAPPEYAQYFADRNVNLEIGQFADVSLEWGSYYRGLCDRLVRGLVVTFDYGFPTERLFDVRIRRYGTAAAFSGHHVHRDLLATPGSQDLTAHINFSDLMMAGEQAGLHTLQFSRQASFLLAIGITGHPLFAPVEEEPVTLEAAIAREAARHAARKLVLTDGIGQEMRVLVQGRGVELEGWSFLKGVSGR